MERYILINRKPVPEPDLFAWCRWLENSKDRQVGITHLSDTVLVSTVFLGLDHRFTNSGLPILFETMVFGGELDGEQERYCTYDEAEIGHRLMVSKVATRETHAEAERLRREEAGRQYGE